jgi:indole-3-glycerol phosphate synthase
MSDFLERLGAASRARVAAARRLRPEALLLNDARGAPAAPPLTLSGFDLIAELKLRSPAAGGLATPAFDRSAQLEAYAAGGAAAVSVLTEPDEFHGHLDHLHQAAELLAPLGCPVMRKDFLTDPYQLIEARAHGAGGALLIVAMLDDSTLETMIACGLELGLFLLLETFDVDDLERIARIAVGRATGRYGSLLIGVNCRNLRTLDVDFGRFSDLADHLPATLPAVAESGIVGTDDLAAVARLGYRLALVGSALMQARGDGNGATDTASVRLKVEAFIAAGRRVRPCS